MAFSASFRAQISRSICGGNDGSRQRVYSDHDEICCVDSNAQMQTRSLRRIAVIAVVCLVWQINLPTFIAIVFLLILTRLDDVRSFSRFSWRLHAKAIHVFKQRVSKAPKSHILFEENLSK